MPANYYIGILVDDTNAVCESNEGNNYVNARITVLPPCTSDLIVSSTLTATPATVIAGGSVTLSGWTVTNQGTASTGVGFSNGFYLSQDAVITTADTVLGSNSNAALAAAFVNAVPHDAPKPVLFGE